MVQKAGGLREFRCPAITNLGIDGPRTPVIGHGSPTLLWHVGLNY